MLSIVCIGQNKRVNQKQVYDKIVKAGIPHPKIVLQQAVHESTNFKYKPAIRKNNYLGLRRKGKLMKFDSVDECICWYKDKVSSRYKGGDYWRFLKRIGYAEDYTYKQNVSRVKLDFIIE